MDFSNVEVTIDHIADAGAKIKAYATVTFDGMFKVHGVRLAESKQGLNIFMPQKAFNKNGKTLYTDVFHPITSGARTALKEAVIDAYPSASGRGHCSGESKGNPLRAGSQTTAGELPRCLSAMEKR